MQVLLSLHHSRISKYRHLRNKTSPNILTLIDLSILFVRPPIDWHLSFHKLPKSSLDSGQIDSTNSLSYLGCGTESNVLFHRSCHRVFRIPFVTRLGRGESRTCNLKTAHHVYMHFGCSHSPSIQYRWPIVPSEYLRSVWGVFRYPQHMMQVQLNQHYLYLLWMTHTNVRPLIVDQFVQD